MAEYNSIFGSAQPAPTPDDINHRRQQELMQQELDLYKAQAEIANDDPRPGRQVRGRRQAAEGFDQRVRKGMQVETPELKMANFEENLRRRLSTDTSLASMSPKEREEYTYKVGAQVADRLQMPNVATQLGQQYTTILQERLKAEAALELVKANTEKARVDIADKRIKTVKGTDPEGNKTEQDFDIVTKQFVGEPRITEMGKYYTLTDGDTNQVMKPNNEEFTTTARTEEDQAKVEADLNRANRKIYEMGTQLEEIEEAMANIGAPGMFGGWFTSGHIGSALSEYGAIPLVGNPARELKANIDRIKAVLSKDNLQAIRDASATGGAYGQVSNYEQELLQNSIATLDTMTEPEFIFDQLVKVKKHYENVIKFAKQEASLDEVEWDSPDYEQFSTPVGNGVYVINIGGKVFEWTRD